jgi:hypothetical protein
MDQSYWRRNIAFRGAVVDVVEGCHLPYGVARAYAAMQARFTIALMSRGLPYHCSARRCCSAKMFLNDRAVGLIFFAIFNLPFSMSFD